MRSNAYRAEEQTVYRMADRAVQALCLSQSEVLMLNLINPLKLKKGDKVAAVSLSWGGAGDPDLAWRYQLGKKRLEPGVM